MVKSLFFAALLVAASPSEATTLQEILIRFSVHAGSTAVESGWSAADKIPGVMWLDKQPRKDVRGRYVRFGTLNLQQHGKASIFLSGGRESISEIDVSISEQEGIIFEQEQFTRVLHSQFSERTQILLIEKCPIGAISGIATYKVTLEGRRSVYAAVMTDSGGTAPNSRGSSFAFSHNYENRWKCAR